MGALGSQGTFGGSGGEQEDLSGGWDGSWGVLCASLGSFGDLVVLVGSKMNASQVSGGSVGSRGASVGSGGGQEDVSGVLWTSGGGVMDLCGVFMGSFMVLGTRRTPPRYLWDPSRRLRGLGALVLAPQ